MNAMKLHMFAITMVNEYSIINAMSLIDKPRLSFHGRHQADHNPNPSPKSATSSVQPQFNQFDIFAA